MPKAPKNPPRVSLPGVEFGVIVEIEEDNSQNSVRKMVDDWTKAVQSAPLTSEDLFSNDGVTWGCDQSLPERPFSVTITDRHPIDAVRAWATAEFGPIHGSWSEHMCYTLLSQRGVFGMLTHFEFDHENDAFAFRMRWG